MEFLDCKNKIKLSHLLKDVIPKSNQHQGRNYLSFNYPIDMAVQRVYSVIDNDYLKSSSRNRPDLAASRCSSVNKQYRNNVQNRNSFLVTQAFRSRLTTRSSVLGSCPRKIRIRKNSEIEGKALKFILFPKVTAKDRNQMASLIKNSIIKLNDRHENKIIKHVRRSEATLTKFDEDKPLVMNFNKINKKIENKEIIVPISYRISSRKFTDRNIDAGLPKYEKSEFNKNNLIDENPINDKFRLINKDPTNQRLDKKELYSKNMKSIKLTLNTAKIKEAKRINDNFNYILFDSAKKIEVMKNCNENVN